MKVGIDTRVLKYMPLEEATKIISNYFSNVEICASHIRELSQRMPFEDIVGLINSLKKEYNISVVQVHAPYGEIDEMWLDDRFDKALEIVRKYVDLCYKIECPILVMHLPYRRPRYGELFVDLVRRQREATCKIVDKLESYLRDLHVRVAFENRLEQTFGCTVFDIADVLYYKGSEMFGICLDTGHANVNKVDIPDVIRRLGKLIIATHLHDNDGVQDRHMPPMTGTVPWYSVIDALARYTEAPLILEVEPMVPEAGLNVLQLCKLVMDYLISKVR